MKSKLLTAYEALTPAQRAAAAEKIGTSTESLRQMAKAYRTGGRPSLTPETAAKVEKVLGVPREATCLACATCSLARTARAAVK